MWPQHTAFICYDPTVLLQIMQVRWGFPHWLLGGVVLISGAGGTLKTCRYSWNKMAVCQTKILLKSRIGRIFKDLWNIFVLYNSCFFKSSLLRKTNVNKLHLEAIRIILDMEQLDSIRIYFKDLLWVSPHFWALKHAWYSSCEQGRYIWKILKACIMQELHCGQKKCQLLKEATEYIDIKVCVPLLDRC